MRKDQIRTVSGKKNGVVKLGLLFNVYHFRQPTEHSEKSL